MNAKIPYVKLFLVASLLCFGEPLTDLDEDLPVGEPLR